MTAAPSIPVIDAAALLGEPMTALCQAPWTQVTAATDSNRCLWKALHKQRYQGFEQGATDVAAAPLSRPACTSARLQASRPPPAGGSWAVGLRPLAPRGPAAPRRRRGGTPRLLSDSAGSAQATAAGRCCWGRRWRGYLRHGGIADRSMIALLTGPRGSASWSLRALRRARYAAWRSAGVWACWPAGGRPRRGAAGAAGAGAAAAWGVVCVYMFPLYHVLRYCQAVLCNTLC